MGLVQGGHEVLCEVTVMMSGSFANHLLLTRYGKLLNELIDPTERRNRWDFQYRIKKGNKQRQNCGNKKRQQEKKELKSTYIRDML